jgi:hypothetical protein
VRSNRVQVHKLPKRNGIRFALCRFTLSVFSVVKTATGAHKPGNLEHLTMGEYAIRNSDNTEVKIGTCEDMLYLRYEDRYKVSKLPSSLDPVREAGVLRFRLPFPDEDDTPIGQYKDPFRGQRLYRSSGFGAHTSNEDFADESTINQPGLIQLRHEASGLMINAPCYHGIKLPEASKDMKPFWNGKGYSFELYQLAPRTINDIFQVLPIVRCKHCREIWRYEWADIWDFVPMPIRANLRVYAEAKATA